MLRNSVGTAIVHRHDLLIVVFLLHLYSSNNHRQTGQGVTARSDWYTGNRTGDEP